MKIKMKMKKSGFKRFIAALLVFFMCSDGIGLCAMTDDYILNDEIKNTYSGRAAAEATIGNLQFIDIDGHWAQEAIVRSGALNILKGYESLFRPENILTNEDALSIILSAAGYEDEAFAAAANIRAALSQNSPLRAAWSLGYIETAYQIGLITDMEYASIMNPEQGDELFSGTAPAKRERVADWLVLALQSVDANVFEAVTEYQSILKFADYNSISAEKANSVEIVTANKIMNGDGNGNFNPQNAVKRSEMAQIFKNLDKHYLNIMGYAEKNGTVGAFYDNQYKTTGQGVAWRNIYIRTDNGSMDSFIFEPPLDAVVYKKGKVAGLSSLKEGDEIQYIVKTDSNELLYVQVVNGLTENEVSGFFYSINPDELSINLRDGKGKHYVYSIMDGILTTEYGVDYIRLGEKKQDIKRVPNGARIKLKLTNNIVTGIEYIGEPTIRNEIRGIVTENNPAYGYLSVINNSGQEVTKFYYENDLKVKKIQFYEEDKTGYISEVFPNYTYNPLDSDISEIEPGDIVFLEIDSDDNDKIISISASTDYVMKYGKVRKISVSGGTASFLLEYEDKGTGSYETPADIFVSRGGKPIDIISITPGDWIKLLVNQAVLGPGHIMESVKEISAESGGHIISSILKGNLAGINDVQKQLLVSDCYELTRTGWGEYNNIASYSISGGDIEYYYNGKQISLDYAKQHLKRSSAPVYIALEDSYLGKRVKKVSFRNERDEALPVDTVIHANGTGQFSILSYGDPITADSGTIVRRYGRLVEPVDIAIPDYAYVVLNGSKNAAVVDIVETPTTSAVTITARGRIQSVDEGKSFKVQSMSILQGLDWNYTPIQREFVIDHNTIFLNADGVSDISQFIGYTENSVVEKAFTIVVDGSRAAYVVDAPFCTNNVKGVIYKTEDGTIYLKDAFYYDNDMGNWNSVGSRDTSISVQIPPNCIMAKNNDIVTLSALETGDKIRIMTNDENMPKSLNAGDEITGFIVLVER